MKLKSFIMVLPLLALTTTQAQTLLYPQQFGYSEITLGDGVFKTAQDLNYKTLMSYDYERLLTPFERQAGFTDWVTAHPNFINWADGAFRLDGHVGGHYISALALAYASCKDATMKAELKTRLDAMISEMKKCQDTFDNNTEGLYGYVGGFPYNEMWTSLYNGDVTKFKEYGGDVPFYVMHKVMAGIRDAYVYGGNATAKTVFLKLCDWTINVVSKLDDTAMQDILGWEHGGMNEVLLDAYQLTKESKYLAAAKKFSHQQMVTNMQTLNTSFLDGLHANTQVPKYIGFARIAQEDTSATNYLTAARNFWADVTGNRTVAIGGNSIDEHFLQASKCDEYVNTFDGPESCNSNNMLKLSGDLFRSDHDAKYVDFYEKAELNHILSTQNPNTGGYVYFTNLRPLHYRNYSQVNSAMWCCVGTGMENHSKYAEFAFTHSTANDSLFVNLFEPVTIDNNVFGVKQEPGFPYEQGTTITVNKGGTYTMAVRHPSWCTNGFAITVNGTKVTDNSTAGSFATVNRTWAAGDIVKVSLPFTLRMEELPNVSNYVAFFYGPVLLAADVENALGLNAKSDMTDMYADDGRMGHCPSQGKKYKLTYAPMLIGERSDVLSQIKAVNADSLEFQIDSMLYDEVGRTKYKGLTLKPFFKTQECRYMVYWNQMAASEWKSVKSELESEEETADRLENRTIDFVATGEQQSDAGHSRAGYYYTGIYQSEYYISCAGGQSFSYKLETKKNTKNIGLMCRYTTADAGRMGTIYIDGDSLTTVAVKSAGQIEFYTEEYSVPESMHLKSDGTAKDTITVSFSANKNTMYPGLYYLRLTKDKVSNINNEVITEEPFTLSGDDMNTFWGTPTFNDTTKTITFAATGDQFGWKHATAIDYTKYTDVVVTFNENPTYTYGLYIENPTTDASFASPSSLTFWQNMDKNVNYYVMPTAKMTRNTDWPETVGTTAAALDSVLQLRFRDQENSSDHTMKISNVFLTNTLPSWDAPVTRTTKKNCFGTICLPYPATMQNCYIYTVKGKSSDNKTIYLEHYNGLLQQGTPYIYMSTSDDGVKFYEIENAKLKATSGGNIFNLYGCLANTTISGKYIFDGTTWKQTTACSAEEAYLDIDAITTTTTIGDASMSVKYLADGINELNNVESKTNKSDAIYNLNGQRVGDDYKGFIIKNGKKYIVK